MNFALLKVILPIPHYSLPANYPEYQELSAIKMHKKGLAFLKAMKASVFLNLGFHEKKLWKQPCHWSNFSASV